MADAYITCTNNDISAEALINLVIVDSDGDPYITCDNNDLSLEDILDLLVVEDADGNPAIAVWGMGGHFEFTTTAGQTQFDTTGNLILNDNYKVFVDGVFQSWGHTRAGNVVTFGVPFGIGHEVSIHI